MPRKTIGIFDSGLGGLAVLRRVREINKSIDAVFYADYKNAPYGTKSKLLLTFLVKNDIYRLRKEGVDKILIGCCTASTVYEDLSNSERAISLPIIAPTAKEARIRTKNGKIGVIATRATVRSGAFRRELTRDFDCEVYEKEAQELVGLIEDGFSDENRRKLWRKTLMDIIAPLKDAGVDTLILGCTHFDWLYRTIEELMPSVSIVSSPVEGAKEIMKDFEFENGSANTYFIGEERGYRNGKIQTRKNK